MFTKTPLEYFDRWPKYFGRKEGAIDILIRYKDGKDDWRPSNGCCGHMRSLPTPENIKSVYGSLWCRYEDLYEAACDYWDYLLSPTESPFRAALGGVERLYTAEGRPIAFGLHDMAAPLQLCISVLIQCRIPQENAAKLRSYKLWRDSGFSRCEALYLSEHLYLRENGNLEWINTTYHHAFAPELGLRYSLILNATPRLNPSVTSWAAGCSYYDNQGSHYKIWSDGTDNQIFKLLKAPEKYSGNFEKVFKDIVSKDGFLPSAGICSTKNAVKILKEHRSEWTK